MKKKSLMLLILLFLPLIIILTGCEKGDSYSTMVINEDGSGTKTIYARFKRDHLFSEADQKSGKVNSSFFPKGQEPVVEWLKDQVPDGFDVAFEEQEDYWVYTISYSFTDIDDYNKKTRQLIKDKHWLEGYLEPAVLEKIDDSSEYNIVFKEQTAILKYSLLGYLEDLHLQTDIFDYTQGGRDNVTPADHFQQTEVAVSIGSDEAKAEMEDEVLPEFVELRCKVNDPGKLISNKTNIIASSAIDDMDDSNSNALIYGIIGAIVVIAAILAYFLFMNEKKKQKN